MRNKYQMYIGFIEYCILAGLIIDMKPKNIYSIRNKLNERLNSKRSASKTQRILNHLCHKGLIEKSVSDNLDWYAVTAKGRQMVVVWVQGSVKRRKRAKTVPCPGRMTSLQLEAIVERDL